MKQKKDIKRSWRKGRALSSILAGVCFFSFLVLNPSPANAYIWLYAICGYPCQIMDQDANDLEQTMGEDWVHALTQRITNITQTTESWEEQARIWIRQFSSFTDETHAATSTLIGSLQLLSINEARRTQSIIDADTLNAQMEVLLKKSYDMQTPSGAENLCSAVTAQQAVPSLARFKDALTLQLVGGFNNLSRKVGSDGMGGPALADAARMKCGDYGSAGGSPNISGITPRNNNPATGSQVDGYMGTCLATDPDFSDADVSSFSLDLSQVYDAPPRNNDGAYIPAGSLPEHKKQRLWMAARQYCYNVLGPRPSILRGANMDTPNGIRERAAFNVCVARQNTFAEACFNRLAGLTRPNENDPDTAAFFEIGRLACQAAQASGITLPPNVNCSRGLSYYQAEQVSQLLCKAQERPVIEQKNGHSVRASIQSKLWCDMRGARWQQRMIKEKAALAEAIVGTRTMKMCWSDLR